ncbi:hypothetical protein ACIQCG_00680 [Streptomyces noursei]|uniref:hypothetical protein n=1 Tax=Streptomyces noursei TaxID=1971 RepID=UPI003803A43D
MTTAPETEHAAPPENSGGAGPHVNLTKGDDQADEHQPAPSLEQRIDLWFTDLADKIIKKMGETPITVTARIYAGAWALPRAVVLWIKAGETPKVMWSRLGAVALALYGAGIGLTMSPRSIIIGTAGAWLVAAWRATSPPQSKKTDKDVPHSAEDGGQEPEHAEVDPTAALVLWIRARAAPHDRVHLTPLLEHAIHDGLVPPDTPLKTFKKHFHKHGIKTDPKVKIKGVPTLGIHLRDLPEITADQEAPEDSPPPTP